MSSPALVVVCASIGQGILADLRQPRSVEAYLSAHSDATFSHGVCPECYEKHVKPQLEKL